MELKLTDLSNDEAIMVLDFISTMRKTGSATAGSEPVSVAAVGAATKTRKARADAGKSRGPNARTASTPIVEAPAASGTPGLEVQRVSPEQQADPTPSPTPPANTPAEKPAEPGTSSDGVGPLTITDCRAALAVLNTAKGLTACLAVFSNFKAADGTTAQQVTKLQEKDYAAFINACNAAAL